jgi:excisionase family DNA binding protein
MVLGELPAILTVAEVAKALRVSKYVVYCEIHQGRLPVIKMGDRVWRVSRTALENWIASR